MRMSLFTPEELAEMAAADEEIDAAPVSQAEREEGRKRDLEFRLINGGRKFKAQRAYREANRDKIAEAQRAYREANRDKIAEAKRAYYEANRDKIAEAKRAYREANRDKNYLVGAALRRWREEQGLTQTQFGQKIGISQQEVSLWEAGILPIDFAKIEQEYPMALEAFG